MWNKPSTKVLSKVPKLYATEDTLLQDKLIHLHFFIGGCDWYVAEIDEANKFMWGFAILNRDLEMAEWGYISLPELRAIRIGFIHVDYDRFWRVRPAREVDTILKAHRHWLQPEPHLYHTSIGG